MGQPYVGEIRMFGGSFNPNGWAMCDGQLMPISENETLFNLIGTTYGGDGQSTFAMPNLQGRVPVHPPGPNNYVLGETGGTESVTLTTSQIPAHNHPPVASTAAGGGTTNVPGNNTILADSNTTTTNPYLVPSAGTQVVLNAQSVGPTGGQQPHDNFQPTLCITYIISLFGVFPTQ